MSVFKLILAFFIFLLLSLSTVFFSFRENISFDEEAKKELEKVLLTVQPRPLGEFSKQIFLVNGMGKNKKKLYEKEISTGVHAISSRNIIAILPYPGDDKDRELLLLNSDQKKWGDIRSLNTCLMQCGHMMDHI